MLITALFTIARLWNQPNCPTTTGWIKKMCVCVCIIYNGVFSHIEQGDHVVYRKMDRIGDLPIEQDKPSSKS
jgi:hypothetical protein